MSQLASGCGTPQSLGAASWESPSSSRLCGLYLLILILLLNLGFQVKSDGACARAEAPDAGLPFPVDTQQPELWDVSTATPSWAPHRPGSTTSIQSQETHPAKARRPLPPLATTGVCPALALTPWM